MSGSIQTIPTASRKKHYYQWYIFAGFVFVLLFLFFTTFVNNNFSLTGWSVMREMNNSTQISINAELTRPYLETEGAIGKAVIELGKTSFINAGDQKISLSKSSLNLIRLDNFEGDLYFDSNTIFRLNGKAENISINGLDILSDSDKRIKVDLKDESVFSSLNLEGIKIKKIHYITSGSIKLKDDALKLEEEELIIKGFEGNLKSKDKLELNGEITSLQIKSDPNVFFG